MLECQIVGLTQDMDFGANISQTFVVLQLPDGRRVRAAVNDDTAQAVVELQVKARGVPRAAAPAQAPQPAEQRAEDGDEYDAPSMEDFTTTETPDAVVRVFGGQVDEASDTSDYVAPPTAATDEMNDQSDLPIIEDPDPEPVRRGRDKSPKRTARMAEQQRLDHAHSPKTLPKNLFRTPTGKLVAPSKTVPKNEAGYPQPSSNGVDPEEITGTRNQDEDGVSSI